MSKVFRAYVNASGVKTGKTANGTIFALSIDPVLHMWGSCCGPRDIGKAFADDIGDMICDVKLTLPGFAECFELFGVVSNVRLKIKKTITVPSWTADVDATAQVIARIVPAWARVKATSRATYLGMSLGAKVLM